MIDSEDQELLHTGCRTSERVAVCRPSASTQSREIYADGIPRTFRRKELLWRSFEKFEYGRMIDRTRQLIEGSGRGTNKNVDALEFHEAF